MLRDTIRIATLVVPADVSTSDLVTEEIANLAVPVAEQVALKGVILFEHKTAAGVFVDPTGGGLAISGANVVYSEPTAGFTALDEVTLGFVIANIPKSTGTASSS
jgi:hypothetical protein